MCLYVFVFFQYFFIWYLSTSWAPLVWQLGDMQWSCDSLIVNPYGKCC